MPIKNKTPTKTPPRPGLHRIEAEMKQWSGMLGTELQTWPHITAKPMFGMLGFYRKKAIFAALPVTYAIGTPQSIIFRIPSMPPKLARRATGDPRLSTGTSMRAKGWHSFAIHSAEDLKDVLWWLNQAYQLAK